MQIVQAETARAEHPLDVVERLAAEHDFAFDRDHEDEIAISTAGRPGRIPRRLHLARGCRGRAYRLRLRPQGAGAAASRGAEPHLAHQRAALGRAFRSMEPRARGDVPPCSRARRRRAGRAGANAPRSSRARSRPATASTRPSNSWSGPERAPRRPSRPRSSRRRARRSCRVAHQAATGG